MPSLGNFAGYVRNTSKAAPDEDPELEKQPPNMDAETHDVVSNPNRLLGARGAAYIKSRKT